MASPCVGSGSPCCLGDLKPLMLTPGQPFLSLCGARRVLLKQSRLHRLQRLPLQWRLHQPRAQQQPSQAPRAQPLHLPLRLHLPRLLLSLPLALTTLRKVWLKVRHHWMGLVGPSLVVSPCLCVKHCSLRLVRPLLARRWTLVPLLLYLYHYHPLMPLMP